MAKVDLRSAAFWSDVEADPIVLGNPWSNTDLTPVARAAVAIDEIRGHVVVETSGSSSEPSFVCLSRRAILCSARAVNAHLGVSGDDRWLCPLPTFHVGGLGIFARAFCADCEVEEMDASWNVQAFANLVESMAATLTALVPTQVADLVAADIRAPHSLRAVVVGGGRIEPSLAAEARALGWPILLSYGMSEAASQIATQLPAAATAPSNDGEKRILPHWQVRCDSDSGLWIRGESLFTAYLGLDSAGAAQIERPFDREGWFLTQDRVLVDGDTMRFLGRVDRVVKILGELVDVDRVEAEFAGMLTPEQAAAVAVEAVADVRRGNRLLLMVEERLDSVQLATAVATFNRKAMPLERLDGLIHVDRIPRSALGKIRRSELRRVARLR